MPMPAPPNALSDSNAALLKELNGALALTGNPTEVERPGAQPPTLESQLETAPDTRNAHPTPLAKLADKTHAKNAASGGYGYRVIVEGDYYSKRTDGPGHDFKKYSLPFNLPALTNDKGQSALGIIVGKLLENALRKMDPRARTYHTFTITSVEALANAPQPTSLQYMGFDALKTYVRDSLPNFPVPLDEYWDAQHLRADVIDFKTNTVSEVVDPQNPDVHVPGGFGLKKSVADRIKERHAERIELRELEAIN